MRILALAMALTAIALTTAESNAQFFRRNTSVNINIGGARAGVNAFRQHTAVNFVQNPAYVNSQLLIDRRHRAAQIVNANTFTYATNTPANIRFRDQGTAYLRQAPIVAAPIIEQYMRTAPQTVINADTGGSTCTTCADPGVTTAPDVNYLTAAPLTAPLAVTNPSCSGTAALTAPQAYTQGVVPARVLQRQFIVNTPAYVRTQRQLIVNQPVVHQRQFIVNQRQFIANRPVVVRQRQFIQQRQFVQQRQFIPQRSFVRQRANVRVNVNRGFLGGGRVNVRVRGR